MTEKDLDKVRVAIIKKLKAKNWTVNRLAEEIDIKFGGKNSSTCSNYLNSGRNCTIKNVEKMLSVLNLKIK